MVVWMVVPFTEMGKGSGGAGKEWVGNQEPRFGLVQFKSVLGIKVKMSRRQLDLCLELNRKVRAGAINLEVVSVYILL